MPLPTGPWLLGPASGAILRAFSAADTIGAKASYTKATIRAVRMCVSRRGAASTQASYEVSSLLPLMVQGCMIILHGIGESSNERSAPPADTVLHCRGRPRRDH